MTYPAAGGARPDLLARVGELVDIPSVSRNEEAIADRVEAVLARRNGLEVRRLGNNVLARTNLGLPQRLILAGHLDTVPPNGNDRAVIEDDACSGLGAVDMKGGLAVMIEIISRLKRPLVDVSFIGYVCEEIEQAHSGLGEIEAADPGWLQADAAVLGEPTASVVEAGCQGVLRVGVVLRGVRAHTARPWMGSNAIHRLAPVLRAVAAYEGRRPVIDGCEYREALQAVRVEGGVANNVVPDSVRLVINHRFAPDRSVEEAYDAVAALVEPTLDTSAGDSSALEDSAPPAAPNLTHPLLARLVSATGQPPRAKLGWTDVSFFTARGIPAANFGPGEPTLAHTAGERVGRGDLDRTFNVLGELVSGT
jgi:succinyl-diaminopimelate desuccinylase